jgi:DNA gyrase inhibitor GyrI
MKFEIKSIPSTKVAYVRRIGPYGQGNLETMAQLKKWAKKMNY